MKKQSFGIILAAVLGAGSLFSAVIPGTDALFTTALPGTGAVTVQAEASNSFGGSGSEPTLWASTSCLPRITS